MSHCHQSFFSPRLRSDPTQTYGSVGGPCLSLIQSELERLVEERSINENTYLRLSNLVLVTYKWDKIIRLAHELHVLALRDALINIERVLTQSMEIHRRILNDLCTFTTFNPCPHHFFSDA